jgi:methylglutamate dehydrogenase subunit D
MAEVALKARSAFAGLVVPGRYGASMAGVAPVVIAERANLHVTQLSVFHGQCEALAEAVRTIAGLELPEGSKRVTAQGLILIGTAPTQWLAIADGEQGRAVIARLAQAASGLAAVVDQSDAKAVLRLSGPRAREVLAKGCQLDLHPRAFTPNDAATTQIALMPCQLWQLDEIPTFELAVSLSYARSFWSWLTSSAAEFGYEVKPAVDAS